MSTDQTHIPDEFHHLFEDPTIAHIATDLGEDIYPGFGEADGPRVFLKIRPTRVIA